MQPRRSLSLLVLLCLAVLALSSLPAVLAGRDFYKILGVPRNANEKAIKKAYRTMSKLHHPDRHQDEAAKEEANKKFQDLAVAYETLSDPNKKRVYDQAGEEGLAKHSAGGGQQHQNPFDMFAHMFGGGGQRHQHGGHNEEKRGDDTQLDLPVTLEELYKGKVFEVQLKQQHLCQHCRGSGARSEGDVQPCNACGGRGVVIKMHQIGPGFMQQVQQQCDRCHGKGKTIKHKCPLCKGAKLTGGVKKLDILLEAGMDDGARIEFEHAGDEHPDHAAGHVIFTVRAQKHPRFERKGNDLHVVERISLRESLVGFEHSLTHLDGHVVPLTSSRVTQHGDVQRISREGMPLHNQASQKGDLFVRYEVDFPASLTKEQREGLEKILPK